MATLTSNINIASLKQTIDKHHSMETIMWYAWEHCNFFPIKKSLQEIAKSNLTEIKKVFDWKLSSPELCKSNPALGQNNDGKPVFRVVEIANSENAGNDRPIRIQLCKATLVNIIFENFLRSQKGLPLIPVFIGIDIDNNKYPSDPTTVCSKDPLLNDKITHKELRRANRLRLFQIPAIAEIAEKTFVYVKVKSNASGETTFERIRPIWDAPEWSDQWAIRQSQPRAAAAAAQKIDWKGKMLEAYQAAVTVDHAPIRDSYSALDS